MCSVKMIQHGEKRPSTEDGAPRTKPALPAKPINIPPPNHHHIVVASSGSLNAINSGPSGKVKQIRKNFTAASKSVDGDSLECGYSKRHFPTSHVAATSAPDEQLRVGSVGRGGGGGGSGMSTTPVVASSSSPRKYDPAKKLVDKKVTPSSPSLGCTNDCCGIILNSSSHKQGLPSSKNGTNCSLSSASTVAKSCFSMEASKLIKTKKAEEGRIKSSSDSVDSSLSSSSGGFRDPDFIARQTMAFELYKSRDTTNSSSSTCITKPPQHIQSISQYQKSSKQLEQMLAQRLEKSLALGGGGPSVALVMSASGTPPVHPNTATHLRARSIDTGIGNSSLSTCSSSGGCYLGSSTIPKQIQQKLQEEMKMQCKNIKEKYLIEKRHPQEHYKPAYREAALVSDIVDSFVVYAPSSSVK